ncbi:hypothetical protein ACM25N_05025 [Roseovarius sp. C7]|uniref:hypothetical protein n=1 Tax=Roseovarius sp. C7 TaxID=3398643 RepID=UPI0039F7432A
MIIRDIALTAALATTTAIGAYAQSLDSGINVEGKVMEDAAQVETETTLDTDTREVKGKTQTSVGLETNEQLKADATVKDLGPDDVTGDTAEDEYDRIFVAAEAGTEVRTSDGALIGTVIEARETEDEHGAIVYVDVAADADIPAKTVGFTLDTLNVATAGNIEYGAEMSHLREHVLDHM